MQVNRIKKIQDKITFMFQIGTFLYRKLGRCGLVLYLQTFQYNKWNSPGIQESGVNIVGILPGHHWGMSSDRPVIISTYWDIEVTLDTLKED